jgi:iron complex transport system ATP-binding protein
VTPPSTTAHLAEVLHVEDLSPAFRRVTLGGEGMKDFGIAHHPLDQRFKLIIPPGGGDPVFDLVDFLERHQSDDLSWYQAWLQVDEGVRGAMRTYTIRDWRDAERELVVDMVLHTDENGAGGPAGSWAQQVRTGGRLHLIGPRRGGEQARSGIEFAPGAARDLLLVGDETAVPAIASILESLRGQDVRGRALLEVPTARDRLDLQGPDGIEIVWLPREGLEHGSLLEPAVHEAVAADAGLAARPGTGGDVELEDVDIDATILWEVPQQLTRAARGSSSQVHPDERPFYAWIAGEAGVVKRLRRYLVREIGVDRRQVAFMGYWRLGKSEG